MKSLTVKEKKIKKKDIIVKIWYESEMAEIWYGKKCLFCGNFWDFHPGCHGTKFKVDGEWIDLKNWKDEDNNPYIVARMFADELKTKVKIKTLKKEWRG